jgi:hypothetical protein
VVVVAPCSEGAERAVVRVARVCVFLVHTRLGGLRREQQQLLLLHVCSWFRGAWTVAIVDHGFGDRDTPVPVLCASGSQAINPVVWAGLPCGRDTSARTHAWPALLPKKPKKGTNKLT